MKVLVAHASRHGATEGIAQRIAERLRSEGLDTDLRPAAQVDRVDLYDAVVVGASAYAFHWLKDATTFVRHNRDVLANRATWLFSSGPLGTDRVDPKTGKDLLATMVPREFPGFDTEIHPREEKVFFGAWDPSAPPIGAMEKIMNLFPAAARKAMPGGDFRDWDEIDGWATHIASELRT